LNVHVRATFVRAAVKENAVTKQLIDTVMPFFPLRCQVISGFLDTSDQFWKVNYHWDNLVFRIEEFLGLERHVAAKLVTAAKAIKAVLLGNPPNPRTGYRTDRTVGATKDQSSNELVEKRYLLVKQSKRDFERVLLAAGVLDAKTRLNPPASAKPWWLAIAPLAPPGDSKHGTGYALDIAGDNTETARIAKALGASLVFNEASHVHCEWKAGKVQLPS
jgi:hypothetical protein